MESDQQQSSAAYVRIGQTGMELGLLWAIFRLNLRL